jgi:KAP family P-loop domain
MPTQSYSDQRAKVDELGFTPSVEALLEIIRDSEVADTPLTIGVFGAWGSGKTSLMGMIADHLDQSPVCLPIWFDAWRYAQGDALWRALLISVIEEIRARVLGDPERLRTLVTRRAQASGTSIPSDFQAARPALEQRLDDLVASLYHSVEREKVGNIQINWPEATKASLRSAIRLGLAGIPVAGLVVNGLDEVVKSAQGEAGKGEDVDSLTRAIRRERSKIYSEQVRSLEQFYQQLKALLEEWSLLAGYRLVIFIDDLDRCLPEQAVGVLEAVKVFLDIQGCVFILGVDREVIEHGIRVRYTPFALDAAAAARAGGAGIMPIGERDYLEKIIQVPFDIPSLDPVVIEHFLQTRLGVLEGLQGDDAGRVARVMSRGLLRNPRKLKRTYGSFRLGLALRRARGRSLHPVQLAKLVVIQSSFPTIYTEVVRRPQLLVELEQVARQLPGASTRDEVRTLVKANPRLEAMLFEERFFADLGSDDLADLVYLGRSPE